MTVIIDCEGCVMRDLACGDCVVSFVLGPPPGQIGSEEQVALAVLAEGGLVPPLRMLPTPTSGDVSAADAVRPPGPAGPRPRRPGSVSA